MHAGRVTGLPGARGAGSAGQPLSSPGPRLLGWDARESRRAERREDSRPHARCMHAVSPAQQQQQPQPCEEEQQRRQQRQRQCSGRGARRRQEGTLCRAVSQRGEEAPAAGLFPAGKKQAKVKLPALWLVLGPESFDGGLRALGDVVEGAIQAGATGFMLSSEVGAGQSGLTQYFEGTIRAKEVIRDRAPLLVESRTDLAALAALDGVILSDQDLSVGLASKLLAASRSALIARSVRSVAEARTATKEGAGCLLLNDDGGANPPVGSLAGEIRKSVSGGTIPCLLQLRQNSGYLKQRGFETAPRLPEGIDGLVVGAAELRKLFPQQRDTNSRIAAALRSLGPSRGPQEPRREASKKGEAGGREAPDGMGSRLKKMKTGLVEKQRTYLGRVLAFLEEHVPSLEERPLLVDALKQLDEPFLAVVVGEFNSGKSTLINALLGGKFLADGILPTTNEIAVLKHSPDGKVASDHEADGILVRRLPADLLKGLNIVDTPGTNVILERQQRLTEEFVPRADLILFTMSADRPFAESEMRFLQYIRRWGKKVMFILNKVDILGTQKEVDEVVAFVAKNARQLLGVDAASVMPVAARKALGAKQEAAESGDWALQRHSGWQESRFGPLEQFIDSFLSGSGERGAESRRLKLQTPLFVVDALLEAAGKVLDGEKAAAEQEEEAVGQVRQQLSAFCGGMERDSQAQRGAITALIRRASRRAQKLVDATLQVSNVRTLTTYLLGSGKGAQTPVVGAFRGGVGDESARKLAELVAEHRAWLGGNTARQVDNYREFARSRQPEIKAAGGSARTPSPASRVEALSRETAAAGGDASAALAVVEGFDPKAAALVLDREVRDVVVTTAGAALGSGALGLVLTNLLPSFGEDVLAVGLSGLLAWVSLLNLPLRRTEVKAKIERVANNLAQDLEGKLGAELEAGLSACVDAVTAQIAPLEVAAAAETARVAGAQARRGELLAELAVLQEQAAAS